MLRRSRARFFGLLALAAIALQMVLAFGHSHSGQLKRVGFDAASVTCLDANGVFCPAPSHHPADHDQSDSTCLICLAAHQVAAAVPPATPEIGIPVQSARAHSPFVSVPARARTGAANFDARGPPAA